jgi:hypothetical protein
MNKQLSELMEADKNIQNHNFNIVVANKITPTEYQLRMDRLSRCYQKRLFDIMKEEK